MKTATEGVTAWLRFCVHAARERGVDCVITNSSIHTKCRQWMLDRGWRLYSPENLTRRFREIKEAADVHGFTITPVTRPGNEQAWRITTTTPTTSSVPSSPSAPTRASVRPMRTTDPFAGAEPVL